MAQPLPRLRMDLDFMPSPVEDRPGLLIRDSYGYSDAVMIIPPAAGSVPRHASTVNKRHWICAVTGANDRGTGRRRVWSSTFSKR